METITSAVVNQHCRQRAIETFGREKVCEIEALVFIADADLIHSTLQSQGDEDGVSIVEMLFFPED